ncbi:zinc finger protein 830 isoform X4 [Engystomops pustulosus]|uniref:zinc finger protein 830 isoform X4 n=1 Tax=Engystomops pustulosus TaxID=76066 RepID=UPI003AFAE871
MPYATVVGRTIMAAAGKKKYVQQDELRRLMKATQRETASKKKVESPLAKYNSLGQLFCALCNIPIKSELLWQAHILGKLHKEKVKELKGFKEQMSSDCVSSAQTTKRKGPILETLTNKRTKDSVEQSSGSSTDSKQLLGFFRTSDQPPHKQTLGNASNMHLPVGEYEAHVEEEEDCESSPVFPSATPQSVEIPLPPRTVPESSLPPDFFDSKSLLFSHSGSILKAEIIEKPVERKENTAEALPEGFFDDPEVDAKVRKVDAPKDHLDKEWEEFQKEIRQVSNETHFRSTSVPSIRDRYYQHWFHSTNPEAKSKGVSIAFHKSLPHKVLATREDTEVNATAELNN